MSKVQITVLLAMVAVVIGSALDGYPMWTHLLVLGSILSYLVAKLFGLRR